MIMLRPLIGRPWALPCDPPVSFDCWELCRHVRSLMGRDTPSVVDRETGERSEAVGRHYFRNPPAGWIEVRHRQIGNVVLVDRGRHCGVYLDNDQMIHCERQTGVSVIRVSQCYSNARYMELTDYA